VQVLVRRSGPGSVLIRVSDDGIGMPAGDETSNSKSLGLQLVHTLTRQIDGRLQITVTQGTRIEIDFPA
jgi:two-component sensor histidine kinase